MHTVNTTETTAGVPAFLAKLWRLVEDPETNHLIYWQSDGRSFVIQNQAQFARELLPLNYKHNNMASFIRQLNMYGFHKISSIDNGGLKFDKDEMEFVHQFFQRDSPHLLEMIKRKIANPKQSQTVATAGSSDDKNNVKIDTINRVMSDVKLMKSRQETLDSHFMQMKRENETLWREVALLRQKHNKQQQIVNKLIQFLVTLVHRPTSGGINNMTGVKRRFQLMINDVPESSVKIRRRSSSSSNVGGGGGGGGNGSGGSAGGVGSSGGSGTSLAGGVGGVDGLDLGNDLIDEDDEDDSAPVIRELTEEILDGVDYDDYDDMDNNHEVGGGDGINHGGGGIVTSPPGSILSNHQDYDDFQFEQQLNQKRQLQKQLHQQQQKQQQHHQRTNSTTIIDHPDSDDDQHSYEDERLQRRSRQRKPQNSYKETDGIDDDDDDNVDDDDDDDDDENIINNGDDDGDADNDADNDDDDEDNVVIRYGDIDYIINQPTSDDPTNQSITKTINDNNWLQNNLVLDPNMIKREPNEHNYDDESIVPQQYVNNRNYNNLEQQNKLLKQTKLLHQQQQLIKNKRTNSQKSQIMSMKPSSSSSPSSSSTAATAATTVSSSPITKQHMRTKKNPALHLQISKPNIINNNNKQQFAIPATKLVIPVKGKGKIISHGKFGPPTSTTTTVNSGNSGNNVNIGKSMLLKPVTGGGGGNNNAVKILSSTEIKPLPVKSFSKGKNSIIAPLPPSSSSSSSSSSTAAANTPIKGGFTNKNDFISTEIPNELFNSQDVENLLGNNCVGSVENNKCEPESPLLINFDGRNYNPTFSEDYTKQLQMNDVGLNVGSSSSISGNSNSISSSSSSSNNNINNNMALVGTNNLNTGALSSTSNKSNNNTMTIAKYNKPDQLNSPEEVNVHLENIQGEIDSIKELFKNDDYTLDANALLGNSTTGGLAQRNRLMLSPSVDSELFSKIFGDLDAPYGLSLSSDYNMDRRNTDETAAQGSELMTYQQQQQQPSFNNLDLSEFLNISEPESSNEKTETNEPSSELNTPCIDRKRNFSFKTK